MIYFRFPILLVRHIGYQYVARVVTVRSTIRNKILKIDG